MLTYKDLIVWQKSIDLCVEIYAVTKQYPTHELYGLVSQSRRCAISISSNIAEGSRRGHKTEYVQFLRIAYGSGAELETQLLIASKVGYLSQQYYYSLQSKLDEIMKMLNKMIAKLA